MKTAVEEEAKGRTPAEIKESTWIIRRDTCFNTSPKACIRVAVSKNDQEWP